MHAHPPLSFPPTHGFPSYVHVQDVAASRNVANAPRGSFGLIVGFAPSLRALLTTSPVETPSV